MEKVNEIRDALVASGWTHAEKNTPAAGRFLALSLQDEPRQLSIGFLWNVAGRWELPNDNHHVLCYLT